FQSTIFITTLSSIYDKVVRSRRFIIYIENTTFLGDILFFIPPNSSGLIHFAFVRHVYSSYIPCSISILISRMNISCQYTTHYSPEIRTRASGLFSLGCCSDAYSSSRYLTIISIHHLNITGVDSDISIFITSPFESGNTLTGARIIRNITPPICSPRAVFQCNMRRNRFSLCLSFLVDCYVNSLPRLILLQCHSATSGR